MFEHQRVDWSDVWSEPYVPSRKPQFAFHPSGAYEDCLRQTWYKMVGAPATNPRSDRAHDIFAVGNAIENILQDKLRRKLTVLEENYNIQHHPRELTLPIIGEIDSIILEDGQQIPVEMKSCKHEKFSDGNYWQAPAVDKPFDRHMIQLTPYMKTLDAPYGYIIYMNKDNQKKVVHKVQFSTQAYHKMVSKFSDIEEYVGIDGGKFEPPPRIDGSELKLYKIKSKKGKIREWNPWQCRFCDFRFLCYADEIIEADAEPEKVAKAVDAKAEMQKILKEMKQDDK